MKDHRTKRRKIELLVIEFQRAEIKTFLEILGKKRILPLNSDQRASLAVKGNVLDHKTLMKRKNIFTPDTILRCHSTIAQKW